MNLSEAQRQILRAIQRGDQLRDHRDLDGAKYFELLSIDNDAAPVPVTHSDVQILSELGLLSSNKKFPSATYWLTESGMRFVSSVSFV